MLHLVCLIHTNKNVKTQSVVLWGVCDVFLCQQWLGVVTIIFTYLQIVGRHILENWTKPGFQQQKQQFHE